MKYEGSYQVRGQLFCEAVDVDIGQMGTLSIFIFTQLYDMKWLTENGQLISMQPTPPALLCASNVSLPNHLVFVSKINV